MTDQPPVVNGVGSTGSIPGNTNAIASTPVNSAGVPIVASPVAFKEPDGYADFSNPVSLQYSELASKTFNTDMYVVTDGFAYSHVLNGHKRIVWVPVGFTTDIASVPRIFWVLLPPDGQYCQAAVLHDYLCEYMQVTQDNEAIQIPRAEVDATLNQAMIDLGVATWKRWLIYKGVCLYRYIVRELTPQFNPAKLQLENQMRATKAATGVFP